MFIFHYVPNEDIQENNPKWSETPDHSYRILILGRTGFGKANALLNLINNRLDIDNMFYMLKIRMKENVNCWESTGLNYLNDSKAFIEYLNDMNDI